MIDVDKSGDYGSAIRGDNATVSFHQADDGPSGYDGIERLRTAENINRAAVGMGAVVIVALIFFCFRLAFDGFKSSSAAKALSGQQYLDDPGSSTAAAVGGPAVTRGPMYTAPTTSSVAARRSVPMPASFVPAPNSGSMRLGLSAAGRSQALSMLSDCRAAYALSGQLSSKWIAAADAANPGALMTQRTVDDSVQPIAAAPVNPITPEEWRTIDTQMTAISTTVTFATQPGIYPDVLGDTSSSLGHEMNTYLQTMRIALEENDPQRRGALVGRADSHRQKAGELLGRLESAIRAGAAPSPAMAARDE